MHMDVLLIEQVVHQCLDVLIEEGYRLVDFKVMGNVSCDRIVFLFLQNFQ